MLIGCSQSATSPTPAHSNTPSVIPATSQACSSFCLDNGDHCVFGANQDNQIDAGLLFVNKRHVLKTAWDPSTSGEYARWISRYGSVTIVHAGYQMAWAGMNEAGLMISTMALGETQNPAPDERPPLASPFWAQYQLDNHSTVEEVIASDAQVRIADTVDHYLVCDRKGDCAIIEFLKGKMVYHTGESLPVKALTNSTYQQAIRAWQQGTLSDNSLERFATAADRVKAFEPTSAESAIAYAFDTLAEVALDINAWRIVFDPANLRVHFRTNRNPEIRYVDFGKLDFSCRTPVMMLDVHADLSGDISNDLMPYSHKVSLKHTIAFFEKYARLDYPPLLLEVLLRGLESFPCKEGDASVQTGTLLSQEHGGPLLPPRVTWVGLAIFHRMWPVWTVLTLLSLAFVMWRMARGEPASWGRRLVWVLVVALIGPFGLLAYLLVYRKRHRIPEVASIVG
jgi:choloylglycine hydrolase